MKYNVIIITGVSGSGKTTVGKELATSLHWKFADADDFHPLGNVEKMKKGIPLHDEDRAPWLEKLNQFLARQKEPLVLACSALKERYRVALSKGINPESVCWIYLYGSSESISKRLADRSGHFMKPEMLGSQLEALEIPEYGLHLNADDSLENIIQKILNHMNMADIGIFGLGVMGTAVARNIASKGFKVALYNRRLPGLEEDVALKAALKYAELSKASGFEDLDLFVANIKTPRIILLMVNAGDAVDEALEKLIPFLQSGDIIIDGGNSYYRDTERRIHFAEQHCIEFMGCGISGGESGALYGPAIMPSGKIQTYAKVEPILRSIAAKNNEGKICCDYLGKGGAGHFIKMVHNGIEYAEMQLISEMYGWMRYVMMFNPEDIALIFSDWNQNENNAYLLEITSAILKYRDKDGSLLINHILDKAGNKGTGGWTTIAACEYGVPAPGLTAALYARFISAQKIKRQSIAAAYPSSFQIQIISPDVLLSAYSFARVMNHLQGLELISAASEKNDWGIKLSTVLDNWSAGCIIRSGLLNLLKEAHEQSDNMLTAPVLKAYLSDKYEKSVTVAGKFIEGHYPAPVLSASLDYFTQFLQARSTAYLIQAQRDYFGAHKYQRMDDAEEKYYHTNWE